jgi:hypothetical protein
VRISELPIRVYYLKELEYIIEKSQLRIQNVFGDYLFGDVNEFLP